MMNAMTATMRILEPYPGLFAFYDGRIEGKRLYSEESNWLDDGAYSLGIASYALVEGDEAIVYDTHISIEHARAIRAFLESRGVDNIGVVLSHWHDDHIAGNAVFADCDIVALRQTAAKMYDNRQKLETEMPPISPLVMPNRLFDTRLNLSLGGRAVELHHFDIHSADGCVLWLPDEQILLAGDTLEDTVTYVSEPEHVPRHVEELSRMETWPIRRILPNHGDPDRIAAGGYGKGLIRANQSYLRRLLELKKHPRARQITLSDFIADEIVSGEVVYFEPYETVHRENIAAMDKVAEA